MISLIYAWTDGWVNNRGAGDLRRYRTHYDVTVMEMDPNNKDHFVYMHVYCNVASHWLDAHTIWSLQ